MDSSKIQEETQISNSVLDTGSNERIEKKWWQIDKEMIRFKLHYFLLSGGLGVIMPFIPVFVKNNLRLSATAFATISTFQQFLNVVITSVVGYTTDYFNKLKTIILVLVILQSSFLCFMFLLPAVPKGEPGNKNTTNGKFFTEFDLCEECIQYKSLQDNAKQSVPFTGINVFLIKSNEVVCFFSEIKSNSSYQFQNKISNSCTFVQNESFINENIPHLSGKNVINLHDLGDYSMWHNNSSMCDSYSSKLCAIFISECVICCNNRTECYSPINSIAHDKAIDEYTENLNDKNNFWTYQFWFFAFVYAIFNASTNAIFMLSNTACCEAMEKHGAEFGKQRLWGAVGWGLFAAIGGSLNDYTSNYFAAYVVYVAIYAVVVWNIFTLDLDKPNFPKDIFKNIRTVVSSKDFLSIEVTVLMNGIGLGFIWYYLMWFLASIGGDGLVCGLVQTVQCFAGEIPFMFVAGWVVGKIGYSNVMSLSLLAYCIRFFWYSRLHNPWMVLPIEWTNGVNYGLVHTSLTTYAKMKAKPGTESTTQALVYATHEGLGSGIGNIIAGFCFDYLGGHQMFFCISVLYGVFTIISVILTVLNRTQKETLESGNDITTFTS